jgi:hypothetical protein
VRACVRVCLCVCLLVGVGVYALSHGGCCLYVGSKSHFARASRKSSSMRRAGQRALCCYEARG